MKFILNFYFILASFTCYSQVKEVSNYFDQLIQYDVSNLWLIDSIQIENDTIIISRYPPLGFIGDDYQRFQIHFISIIHDSKSKPLYHVYGKSRVKDNISAFQGTIEITNVTILKEGDLPPLQQGSITGSYLFLEDPKDKATGTFEGMFKTNFYIDSHGEIKYDALEFVADGFNNNQFEGTWKSYKSGIIKKCNWGDYRIPESGNFDGGAGEFSPSEKYLDNGWRNYDLAWSYSSDNPRSIEARKKEYERWWIDHGK